MPEFQCNNCKRVFTENSDLKYHNRESCNSAGYHYKCVFCLKQYFCKNSLESHMQNPDTDMCTVTPQYRADYWKEHKDDEEDLGYISFGGLLGHIG